MPKFYSIPVDGPVGELVRAAEKGPIRPAHVHFLVKAPGYETLVTHLFVKGDPHINSDAVYAVKPSLIVDFVEKPAGTPMPDGGKTATALAPSQLRLRVEAGASESGVSPRPAARQERNKHEDRPEIRRGVRDQRLQSRIRSSCADSTWSRI